MQEYTKRKQEHAGREAGRLSQTEKAASIPNSSMEAIMAGRARASSEMMGHRQDLAPSLNAKMAKAFGMDLSNMQIYRSEAMSGTETQGLASGNKIVLSSDIDLNTTAGQAILGHEISHVHAQNQGIGMGHSGLYQNAGLEHQADMEGMMAARGQSILGDGTGMDMGLGMGGIGGLTPLGAGMSASAGAPMQAKGKGRGRKKKKAAAPAPAKATMPEILKPTSTEPAVPEAPVTAPPVAESPAPAAPVKQAVELGKPTVSPERAAKERKFGLLNKLAGTVAGNMQGNYSLDESDGFDANFSKYLKGTEGIQYQATVKNTPVFKKLVQASLLTKQNNNKENGQVFQKNQNEWYNNTLLPSLLDEYITGEASGIPLDFMEVLKSRKK